MGKFKYILLIVSIVLLILFLLSAYSVVNSSAETRWATTLSLFLGCISFIFSVYSISVLRSNIRDGAICTKRMAKKGGKKIASEINSYKPDFIIYVGKNSNELYMRYIYKYVNLCIAKNNIFLQCTKKIYGKSPYKHDILTNKFYIDVEELQSYLAPKSRVIIFDDITKTGETIIALKDYIINTCGVSDSNILTCGFAVDKYGYASAQVPGYYFMRAEIKDTYHFPWIYSNEK